MMQAAAVSRTPVVATHSCVRALCDHARNLDDEQLDLLGEVGGVVHVTGLASFLKRDTKPELVTVSDFADHIDCAVRRIGGGAADRRTNRDRAMARGHCPCGGAAGSWR